jgi:carboxylate-amine ligase
MARMEAESPPPARRSQEAIEEACYQATRYGLEALLPDDEGVLKPACSLARSMIHRVYPFARELGCEAELEGVEMILREGSGADIQRRIHAREGMPGLVAWLMERGDRPWA